MRIMVWYSIDVINAAVNRTKKIILEPFDFWKWIKLGIIILFIGGGFGSSGSNFDPGVLTVLLKTGVWKSHQPGK